MTQEKTKGHPRLADIAADVGVSIVTVAKVLHSTGGKNTRVSAATANKIKASATRLNYHPNMVARQLAGKKSGVIGVLIDSGAPPIYHQLLLNMEKYAEEHSFKLMIGNVHENPNKVKEYVNSFIAYGADALICQAHAYPDIGQELVEYCANAIDTVFIGRPEYQPERYCYVDFNIESVVRQAVKILLEQGRKRLGMFVLGGYFQAPSMNRRCVAFRNALTTAGIEYDHNLIKTIPHTDVMNKDKFLPLIRDLVENRKVDAIINANDYLAAMTVKSLLQLKIEIPRQVAVIGTDDIDIASLLTPTLSTFSCNQDACAKALIETAEKLINKQEMTPDQRARLFDPIYIRRETT